MVQVLEHFDALWGLVSTISADNSWSSPLLLAPARAFTAKLAEKGSHALPLFTLPKHTPGCTYPMLLRLRLLPDEAASSMDTEDAEEGAAPESGGAAAAGRGGTGTMAPAERTLFEEYTSMVAQAFFESHRDGAKQLQALQGSSNPDPGSEKEGRGGRQGEAGRGAERERRRGRRRRERQRQRQRQRQRRREGAWESGREREREQKSRG